MVPSVGAQRVLSHALTYNIRSIGLFSFQKDAWLSKDSVFKNLSKDSVKRDRHINNDLQISIVHAQEEWPGPLGALGEHLVWDQEKLPSKQGRNSVLSRWKVTLVSQKRIRAWKVWVMVSSFEWPGHELPLAFETTAEENHIVSLDSIGRPLNSMKL